MGSIGVRELGRRASAIVDEVTGSHKGAVITKRGQPVAVLLPIDAERFEDHVLTTAPEFVADLHHADVELAGGRTVALNDLLAELDA